MEAVHLKVQGEEAEQRKEAENAAFRKDRSKLMDLAGK